MPAGSRRVLDRARHSMQPTALQKGEPVGALNTLSAVELARELAAGKITSEMLVRDCFERIAAREPDVQAQV